MKVGNYIISIVKRDVKSRVRKNNASQATKCKKKEEAQDPKNRRFQNNRSAVERGQSGENFNPSRNSNEYSGRGEVGPSINIYANCKHMMCSNNEP